MELSDKKKKEFARRILMSRMRILINHGFYGLLLMHMDFALDEEVKTAATDARKIYFAPSFLDELTDEELDFIMMHEILHVALQHCLRVEDRDPKVFNIACDVVVNSNILLSNNMDKGSITLHKYGESMHVAPDGKEGYEYTAEQVYEMFSENRIPLGRGSNRRGSNRKKPGSGWDDHSRWKQEEDKDSDPEDEELKELWTKRLLDACETIQKRDPSNARGAIPLGAERVLKELKDPQVDWKTILNNFIQEEITDYSFTPPDRRFDDCPFFLPDYNEKNAEDTPTDVLFMIDTSASMSDEMVTAAYSEVKGAIDQFGGKLRGWLGFFDAEVIPPIPFTSEAEFRVIHPKGGGGTSFHAIFKYVREKMQEHLPADIIILTDGYANFPKEKDALGIPVLWVINNEEAAPPWGKIARIKV